jgi:hypothetical protein
MYCQMSSSVQLRQREHPDVLALAVPAVVEAPQLGALVLGVPLAEVVAEAEHPLLGPGLLLVAAGAAERGVEAVLLDAVAAACTVCSGCGWRGPVCSVTRPSSMSSCTDATTSRTPCSATRRSRNSMTSGSCGRCRRASPGTACGRPERLLGQVQHDDESLPPLNSSTGRSNSAATSRMMWIASASSERRWHFLAADRCRPVGALVWAVSHGGPRA